MSSLFAFFFFWDRYSWSCPEQSWTFSLPLWLKLSFPHMSAFLSLIKELYWEFRMCIQCVLSNLSAILSSPFLYYHTTKVFLSNFTYSHVLFCFSIHGALLLLSICTWVWAICWDMGSPQGLGFWLAWSCVHLALVTAAVSSHEKLTFNSQQITFHCRYPI